MRLSIYLAKHNRIGKENWVFYGGNSFEKDKLLPILERGELMRWVSADPSPSLPHPYTHFSDLFLGSRITVCGKVPPQCRGTMLPSQSWLQATFWLRRWWNIQVNTKAWLRKTRGNHTYSAKNHSQLYRDLDCPRLWRSWTWAIGSHTCMCIRLSRRAC